MWSKKGICYCALFILDPELEYYYYHPYFTEEEAETQRASTLMKVTQSHDLNQGSLTLPSVPSRDTDLLSTWGDLRQHKRANSFPYILRESLRLAGISIQSK